MKNHTFDLAIKDTGLSTVSKIIIPDDYREKIESGDTINETFKVIGHSKVAAKTLIVFNGDLGTTFLGNSAPRT